MPNPALDSSVFEQKRSLEQLIDESRARGEFYLYLVVGGAIATFGLLSNNVAIIIGGMLVAPLMYPILFLAMAVTTTSRDGILRALKVLGKSVAVTICTGLVIAFLFHDGVITTEIALRVGANLMSFLIAFLAGLAAAYGWVRRQSASSILAGIAVSVSLIPPLTVVGIGIAVISKTIIAGAFTLFLVNLLGVVLSALLIFSLFGFSRLQKEEESKLVEEKIEDKIRERAVADQARVEEAKANGTLPQ